MLPICDNWFLPGYPGYVKQTYYTYIHMCDNIICVWRNRYKEKLIEEGKTSDDELKIIPDAKVFIQKQRNGQWEGSFNFWFSQKTLCYRESP